MAERIAAEAETSRFGVRGMWVFGSAKNGTARAASDLDLLIHVDGDRDHGRALSTWLDGWSACLAEINELKTGVRLQGLLDVHYLTDEDLRRRTGLRVEDSRRDGRRPRASSQGFGSSAPSLKRRPPQPAFSFPAARCTCFIDAP